jgi:predicted DnaQ family exonuclease/DinG family helicase
MPRLFDLLSDDAKKGLAAEAGKGAGGGKGARVAGKKGAAPFDNQHGRRGAPADSEQGADRRVPPDSQPGADKSVRSGENRYGRRSIQSGGSRPADKNNAPPDSRSHIDKNKASPDNHRHTDRTIDIPDFVALDVETTGLDFKRDRVIEVGAVRFVNGKPEAEFSTFVNAGIPIPDHITRLTHIADDDIRSAPSFRDIAARLIEFMGALPLCGHQTDFDLTFINEEFKRAGFPEVAPQIIDTALMSRVLLQNVGRFSLKHACDALGVALDNAHRALHDARASGELAVRLIPKLCDLPLNVRQALAAFAPASMFKTLAIRSLFGARYGVNLAGGEPLPNAAQRAATPEEIIPVDTSEITGVFSDEDATGRVIKGFRVRSAQQEMALRVTRALNERGILTAEAGTGTGKSLAYLLPAALHALKNNCRVLVSTHTRNLQDQLISKDLPGVAALCGGELRYSKLKGRGNYLCRNRFYKLLRGEIGNFSPRERGAALPLVVWSQYTETGDIEEQTFFNPKWFFKVWNLISADSLECAGRRCPYHSACFLQKARQLAQSSHIVVINHALFYSDVCSETSFLGAAGAIIFDEAHHLESSGHQHLRTELDTNRVTAFVDRLQNLLRVAPNFSGLVNVAEFDKELKHRLKHIRKSSQDMMTELDNWALFTVPASTAEYQIAVNEDSFGRFLTPAIFDIALGGLQDAFYEFRQILSGVRDREKIDELRDEVQACAEQTSQLRADLQYLTAAKTEDHVFWAEGNHGKGWAKLCGVPLDISELLAQIWERCGGGLVFTSATLATQGSMEYVSRAIGLERFADRVESVILPSPYGAAQTLFCAFRDCPDPDAPEFAAFAAEAIAAIHAKLSKNVLALFTSNAMLGNVYDKLKARPEVDRNNILAQGYAGSRNSMLEQFKTQSAMILLGTDSFWEGVDAPGEACEAVVIPRLPFPGPTHPLTLALGKRMEERSGSAFFSYSVPEAVIKFRQGAGRLIRSANDRGALVVLDNRILTKGYGKQFSKSVESGINEFGGVDEMTEAMRNFFNDNGHNGTDNKDNDDAGPVSTITYVPFEDL